MSRKKYASSELFYVALKFAICEQEKMERPNTYAYFFAALKALFPGHFNSQKALAITAGISRSMVSEILKGKKFGSPDLHEKISRAFGYELFEFYDFGRRIMEKTGAGHHSHHGASATKVSAYEPEEIPTGKRGRPKKVENLEHDEIIRRFKDKESARRFNMMLVELESKDPDLYKQAEAYVSALYDTLKVKKTSNE